MMANSCPRPVRSKGDTVVRVPMVKYMASWKATFSSSIYPATPKRKRQRSRSSKTPAYPLFLSNSLCFIGLCTLNSHSPYVAFQLMVYHFVGTAAQLSGARVLIEITRKKDHTGIELVWEERISIFHIESRRMV